MRSVAYQPCTARTLQGFHLLQCSLCYWSYRISMWSDAYQGFFNTRSQPCTAVVLLVLCIDLCCLSCVLSSAQFARFRLALKQ
jgi:hypothetical protein